MELIDRFVLSVRRRETPFHDGIYRAAKTIRRLEFPDLRLLYKALNAERDLRLAVWRGMTRLLYHQPMFKAKCERAGKGLYIYGGIPLIMGHLKVRLGDFVTLSGVTTFLGSKLVDEPVLDIDDHAHIGHQVVITVGTRVTIGKYAMIANRCTILGADMHPIDPIKRRTEPENLAALKSLIIEDDAYIATGATLYKGVTIGKGAVVAAGSVVTKSVPPYTIVAGNPARIVWRIAPR